MVMADEGNIIRCVFTGEEHPEDHREDQYGEEWLIILPHVTHLSVHESITTIRGSAFRCHPNIVELICHAGVIKIGLEAFTECPRLKRLIMKSVEEVEGAAFCDSEAIEHVECKNLEIIGRYVFSDCKSLGSIELPSAKVVKVGAFAGCGVLRDVRFGTSLVTLEALAFAHCPSLERITIPLKNGLFEHDNLLQQCDNLKRLDLVEDNILHETVAALLMKEWRQDMSNEIDSINQILPNTPATAAYSGQEGGKGWMIRELVQRVLSKIIYYKAQHCSLLNEAATLLQLHLPNDIVHNNVLAFLELPLHTFDGEDATVEQR